MKRYIVTEAELELMQQDRWDEYCEDALTSIKQRPVPDWATHFSDEWVHLDPRTEEIPR